jgi:phage terminase Nu1 subunit (DNA packaging protein)
MDRGTTSKPRTSTSAARPVPVSRKPATRTSRELPWEAVATAAYYRWMSRGCPQGQDQQDWFEAEREVRERMES